MDTLFALDRTLFFAINHLPHSAILDTIALTLSGIGKAGLVWFVIAAFLFYREEKKHPRFFIPIAAAGIASWVLVDWVLKPFIARPRPTEILTDFSFPSGHATIAFAMAVVLSRYEPRWKWGFFGLAGLIAFSRIYLGVHYPLDVLGGALLGWGIGGMVRRFVL